MSFNSGVFNHIQNGTMTANKQFSRKTMISDYEKPVVEVVGEPLDPDLLYWYDFTGDNIQQEKITKDPMFDITMNDGSTFTAQEQDYNGDTGIRIAKTPMTVNNNQSSFPIGTFDHISDDGCAIVMEYSIADEFDIQTHNQQQDTSFFLQTTFLYKFGTTQSSQDIDDALQPSGFHLNLNSKDKKFYPRFLKLDKDQLPTVYISVYRPTYQFYNSNSFGWRAMTTLGYFPYNRSGKHTITFGYKRVDGALIFYVYLDNDVYFENQIINDPNTGMIKNRHLPMLYIRDLDYLKFSCTTNLKSVKVFNRAIELNELPDRVDRFPFLYHFITGKSNVYYNWNHVNVNRVIQANHVQYLQFDDNAPIYARIDQPDNTRDSYGIDMTSPVIWYEYELEIRSSTSTFAIDFFNVFRNNQSPYSTLTNNYFSSSYSGLCFGVDGDQFIKYKCGSTIVTTTTQMPLNTKKYLSFAYTATEVKFYYDKQLIGTVLKSTDASLWTHLAAQTYESIFGVFNLGLSGNRGHFIVRHSFTEDRGTLDNNVLI